VYTGRLDGLSDEWFRGYACIPRSQVHWRASSKLHIKHVVEVLSEFRAFRMRQEES
jgi:hypothetical protein